MKESDRVVRIQAQNAWDGELKQENEKLKTQDAQQMKEIGDPPEDGSPEDQVPSAPVVQAIPVAEPAGAANGEPDGAQPQTAEEMELRRAREDQARAARGGPFGDGPTVLLQCQTGTWSRRSNNWLGFDAGDSCRIRAMHERGQAVPFKLHWVAPFTYQIEIEGRGWLGRSGIHVFGNKSRGEAMRVHFDMGRFDHNQAQGRVILKCIDNDRFISHRSAGHGSMVACYGNGGQSTENDIDFNMIMDGESVAFPAQPQDSAEEEPDGAQPQYSAQQERCAGIALFFVLFVFVPIVTGASLLGVGLAEQN